MIERTTRQAVLPYLPCRLLSLGYPDGLTQDDLAGSDVTVVDVIAHRGTETLADLNAPHEFGTFDLVLDPGTCEHCANPGQAWRTAIEAVALYGHLVQTAPLTMLNHGFWNYCPQVIREVYQANGLTLQRCEVYTLDHQPVRHGPLYARTTTLPDNCWALVVGERHERVSWTWPRQGCYAC